MIHARFRISGWKDIVRAAVAGNTRSCTRVSLFRCLTMKTPFISNLLVSMTLRTRHLGGRALVRRALDIAVAVDTGEHAVNRILEVLIANEKADLLAGHLLAHR